MTDDLMEKVQGLPRPAMGEQPEVLISDTRPKKKKISEFEWRDFLEKQLFKIASLPANWDRMGADPPNKSAIFEAYRFLNMLSLTELEIPKPGISPTASGGLQYDWELGSKAFEVEFETNGVISYLYEDEEKLISHEESLYPGENTEQLLTYLRKMYG